MTPLADSFGRRFSYLRLSVTDACNFKCQYCLPNGYKKTSNESFLSAEEIGHLVAGFAEAGTRKIRLTGGEPTLRRDLLDLTAMIARTPGIQSVGLSTNGWNLKTLARPLRAAGLERVNVSVDSLDPARFALHTGTAKLSQVLDGIEAALAEGYRAVKLNAVLLRAHLDDEFRLFQDFARTRPVSIRFIELMPTLGNREYFTRQHVRSTDFAKRLVNEGWRELPRGPDDGPAREYAHPDFAGRFGLIAPYGQDFCGQCNRLRVTSRGGLRLCLFGEGEHSLRPYLQRAEDRDELHACLKRVLTEKKVSHFLTEERVGDNRSFSAMGG